MARTSAFGPRRTFIKTGGSALSESNFFSLGGLNYYAPDELMKDNESPYARNFRIFKEDDAEARVAVSKRDGHSFYTVPVGETERFSQSDTTGAADYTVDTIHWIADKCQLSGAGRMTKVEVNVKNDNSGTGPLLVQIYSDASGEPGALLGTSSIANSSIAGTYSYDVSRFIEAPVGATSTDYWVVVHMQDDSTNDYKVSTCTSADTALISSNAGNTWTAANVGLNFKVYASTDGAIKAVKRFYRTNAAPQTLFIQGTTMYSVNDLTGAVTSVETGLDANAEYYKFTTIEDILYFVNGVDVPKKYDGSTVSDVGGDPGQGGDLGVAIDIALHKNLLFILFSSNAVVWSIEDNTSYEVFETDAIQYIPSPKSGDKAFAMVPYQDNLLFLTRNTKWVLYGYDRATFQLRESTASKGPAGPNAFVKEGSYIYFLGDDKDIYAFNGGTDKSIGKRITRVLGSVADLTKVVMIVHDGKLRLYYTPSGQAHAQNCLVYDLLYEQWMLDTEIYTGTVAVLASQNDANLLVHGSSLGGFLMYAETGSSDMGKPILFDYWTKYFSFGHPSRKHRVKRLYPFIRPGTGPYYCDVQIDVDNQNSPSSNPVYLGTSGALWGDGSQWGDGTVWGGGILEPTRLSIPGQARKHQIRFVQHGADQEIEILGFSTYTKMRKPI